MPVEALMEAAGQFERVLVVDETRMSGGVAEAVLAALVDHRWPGRAGRIASADSFIPLGPAAEHVLLSEADIVTAARDLLDLPRA
jgi:2-oxoisovalerate dehydrogenase E1 component